ncbi:amidohydrolase family protein [Agrococcus sp. ARC_14]|uniref:amidohydrolase n=1 Tax=Agrococcus sp. ARC_14 TaxID=2919927 RepID=UPI001F05B074|nr:amidohydrolase family protein [Agrococcus sp. ARC_14]MCH1884072.1 amidohydrolase family protein [Agrococcus sp. ARC_14]
MRLANARLLVGSPSDSPLVDLDIVDGEIERVSPAGSTASAGQRHDLEGATVVPGLWDEHTHLGQWARHRTRPSVLDAESAEDVAASAGAAAGAHTGADPLVLVGMRDALWPAPPTRELLDAATGATPTLIVSSDVHCSWPNSAMLARLGLRLDGPLLREDAAFDALQAVEGMLDADTLDRHVVDALASAAARGVAGVVDLEFDDAVGAWLRPGRATPTRVEVGIYQKDLELAADRGLRTGDRIAGTAHVGRLKVITDGSLGTRTAWTTHPYDDGAGRAGVGVRNVDDADLDRLLARAGQLGLGAAVHAIGDAAVSAAIDAFERAARGGAGKGGRELPGARAMAGDRIEHAQLVAAADIPRMARLGLVASVQPEHALDDRELTASLWSDRAGDAFRIRSLLDAGVPVVLGSDAPVTPLDPWRAIATAVTRTRGDEQPWQPEEAISIEQAIAASARTRIAAGEPADLVVLADALPSADDVARDPNGSAERLRATAVTATLIAGELVHGSL